MIPIKILSSLVATQSLVTCPLAEHLVTVPFTTKAVPVQTPVLLPGISVSHTAGADALLLVVPAVCQ